MKAKRGLSLERMVKLGPGFPVRLLPVPRCRAESGPRHGSAGRDTADRVGVAQLWASTHHPRTCGGGAGG